MMITTYANLMCLEMFYTYYEENGITFEINDGQVKAVIIGQ